MWDSGQDNEIGLRLREIAKWKHYENLEIKIEFWFCLLGMWIVKLMGLDLISILSALLNMVLLKIIKFTLSKY